MGFASAWLAERSLFPLFITEKPDDPGLIVVVPAYDEPGISALLDSLSYCYPPECNTEVIVVINAPGDASEIAIRNNEKCRKEIEVWKQNNENPFFKLYIFDTGRSELKDWGVGLARKTGMDEALRRFDEAGNPDGIIVCLDADCRVAKNYFQALESEFLKQPSRKACSIYFEHDTSQDVLAENSIWQYELHLRYYVQGQVLAGFPYAFHTVGSSMAVRASQYLKCGGMNRKQAGEDFYFIQKLSGLGGFFTLNSTTVYPSSRQSYRVPFGTGAMMRKLASEKGGDLYTYNIDAFLEMKLLFDSVEYFRLCDTKELNISYNKLGPGLRQFFDEKEFIQKICEIRENTSGADSFRKRFFNWFNMFRIVRFLNSSHLDVYDKQPVIKAAIEIMKLRGIKNIPDDASGLLRLFRELEKG